MEDMYAQDTMQSPISPKEPKQMPKVAKWTANMLAVTVVASITAIIVSGALWVITSIWSAIG